MAWKDFEYSDEPSWQKGVKFYKLTREKKQKLRQADKKNNVRLKPTEIEEPRQP